MKKTLFAAVLAVACIGAFAFKAHTTSITYYYDGGEVTNDEDICPGTGNQCQLVVGEEVKDLFENQQLTIPAQRN